MTTEKMFEEFKNVVLKSKDDLIHDTMQRVWDLMEQRSRNQVEEEKKANKPRPKGLSPKGGDIVVVTGYTRDFAEKFPKIAQQMHENRNDYCKRHGYHYLFVDLDVYKPNLEEGIPLHWLKLYAIKQAFDQFPDSKWIFWIDADALFMTPELDFASHILDKEVLKRKLIYGLPMAHVGRRFKGRMYKQESEVDIDNIELILCHDTFSMNSGGMLLKRTDYIMHTFMDMWLTQENMRTKYVSPEQDVMIELILNNDELYNKLGLVPTSIFNSYWEDYWVDSGIFRKGDLICHFPGKSKSPEGFEKAWNHMWDHYKGNIKDDE